MATPFQIRRGMRVGSMTSSTIARSALAAVLAATLAAVLILVPVPKVEAWSSGACTTTNGVTVIVDYAGLGGGTVVRCASGSQSSGVTALRNAGFSVSFVQQNMSQGLFVCRIDGKPVPSAESCANTPPANASWSYWHADRGGSWRYSSAGAGNRRPPAGSVEGWRFTNGRPAQPSVVPPAPIPAKPTTKPTVKPTTKPTHDSNGSSGSSSGSGSSGSKSNGSSAGKAQGAASAKGASVNPSSSQSASPTTHPSEDSVQAADTQAVGTAGEDGQPSSPVGTLIAIAALLLLGIGGAIAWARRSRDG